jgi:hypothetical protein
MFNFGKNILEILAKPNENLGLAISGLINLNESRVTQPAKQVNSTALLLAFSELFSDNVGYFGIPRSVSIVFTFKSTTLCLIASAFFNQS